MPDQLTFDDVARPFAVGLHRLGELSRDVRLTKAQRARVLEAMSSDIRKLCDIAVPSLIPYDISHKAWGLALHTDVDLRQASWHRQGRFDLGRTRFHLEHVLPVKSLRSAVLVAADVEEVIDALRGIRIAWILKAEDAELTSLGFRTHRTDPTAAYAAAAITFVEPAEMDYQWDRRYL